MDPPTKDLLKKAKLLIKELKTEGDGMMKKSHYADASERYIEATKLISKQLPLVEKKLKPWVPILLKLQATCHLKTGAWKACVETASLDFLFSRYHQQASTTAFCC